VSAPTLSDGGHPSPDFDPDRHAGAEFAGAETTHHGAGSQGDGVFVDPTGRRGRRLRALATALPITASAVLMAFTLALAQAVGVVSVPLIADPAPPASTAVSADGNREAVLQVEDERLAPPATAAPSPSGGASAGDGGGPSSSAPPASSDTAPLPDGGIAPVNPVFSDSDDGVPPSPTGGDTAADDQATSPGGTAPPEASATTVTGTPDAAPGVTSAPEGPVTPTSGPSSPTTGPSSPTTVPGTVVTTPTTAAPSTTTTTAAPTTTTTAPPPLTADQISRAAAALRSAMRTTGDATTANLTDAEASAVCGSASWRSQPSIDAGCTQLGR
jgi:hypothetical protein